MYIPKNEDKIAPHKKFCEDDVDDDDDDDDDDDA